MSDKKRNASERIEDLERAVMALYQTADNMARDILTAKEAIKLLGNKVDAVAKILGATDERIGEVMVENNVAELKSKVDELVKEKVLVASEVVTENSFVVGKEVNDTGTVVNPRLQFSLSVIAPELKEKMLGAKPGQLLDLQPGKLKFEVVECYDIQNPAQSASETVVETTAEESSPTREQSAPEETSEQAAQ